MDLNTLVLTVHKMSGDNALPLEAKRECDIQAQVTLHENPMSKRAVEHNLGLMDPLNDLNSFVSINNQPVVATPLT